MPDGYNIHGRQAIIYFINHAIVANANAPKVYASPKLLTTTWTRGMAKCFHLR